MGVGIEPGTGELRVFEQDDSTSEATPAHTAEASRIDTSADVQALMHQTADHAEAVAAFVEKRQPRFTGE